MKRFLQEYDEDVRHRKKSKTSKTSKSVQRSNHKHEYEKVIIREFIGYRESWSYSIIPERLIAYNHGKINEIQVEGIEKNLSRIISQFEDLKRDLVFLLSEKEE